MNDKQLEALVNHIALEAGSGLGVGTLYGDMALAVAKEVRERCANVAESWTEYAVAVPSIGPRIAHAIRDSVEPQCCNGGPQWGHAWDCKKCPD